MNAIGYKVLGFSSSWFMSDHLTWHVHVCEIGKIFIGTIMENFHSVCVCVRLLPR